MADRLTGLDVFVRAVTLGGLSAAARALGMSPAMAGRHLAALEARLGVTLVRRTTRRLSLTEAGRNFHPRAQGLLAELAEAEAEAAAESVEVVGLLRVSTPVSFGTLHIAPLLGGFARLYPRVRLELGLNDRTVDLMEEGWDVAIRIGRLSDSSLIARRPAPARLVLCASPAYLAERGTPGTPDDIRRHDCLGYTFADVAGAKTWTFGAKGDIRVPVSCPISANNGEVLLAAALAGRGLLYGPRFIAAAAIADGRLHEITLDQPCADLGGVYAITHPDRRATIRASRWIDYLRDALMHVDL